MSRKSISVHDVYNILPPSDVPAQQKLARKAATHVSYLKLMTHAITKKLKHKKNFRHSFEFFLLSFVLAFLRLFRLSGLKKQPLFCARAVILLPSFLWGKGFKLMFFGLRRNMYKHLYSSLNWLLLQWIKYKKVQSLPTFNVVEILLILKKLMTCVIA